MAQSPNPPDTPLFRALWAAQSGLCALCGAPMPAHRGVLAHATLWKRLRPSFDHIRPRSKGGTGEAGNLQLAHAACNRRKGNRWTDRAQ